MNRKFIQVLTLIYALTSLIACDKINQSNLQGEWKFDHTDYLLNGDNVYVSESPYYFSSLHFTNNSSCRVEKSWGDKIANSYTIIGDELTIGEETYKIIESTSSRLVLQTPPPLSDVNYPTYEWLKETYGEAFENPEYKPEIMGPGMIPYNPVKIFGGQCVYTYSTSTGIVNIVHGNFYVTSDKQVHYCWEIPEPDAMQTERYSIDEGFGVIQYKICCDKCLIYLKR